MSVKRVARLRRAKRARAKISELRVNRLTVYRTPRHIYAQVIAASGLREGATGNVDAASKIGKLIAERAKAAGVEKVAFDRSGYAYHGRVKALADAAREGGLDF